MRVRDDFTRIIARAENPLNEPVEIEGLGPADFHGSVQGTAGRNPRDDTRDIVSGNRLYQHGRYANDSAVGIGGTPRR